MIKKLCSSVLRTGIPGKTLVAGLALVGLAYTTQAVPVTVEETGMGPNEIVQMTSSTLGTANVYAGPVNLLINGVATTGFCIDPFHWSITGPQAYNTEVLGTGPKAPGGPMGAATALKIEQLWNQYYLPNISSQNGAGLQIAIWELVGGPNFTLDSSSDYGAGDMLSWVNNNATAPAANLIAVTGPGQDYVIPIISSNDRNPPSVPDGGETIMLLSMGLGGLAMVRAKFNAARSSK